MSSTSSKYFLPNPTSFSVASFFVPTLSSKQAFSLPNLHQIHQYPIRIYTAKKKNTNVTQSSATKMLHDSSRSKGNPVAEIEDHMSEWNSCREFYYINRKFTKLYHLKSGLVVLVMVAPFIILWLYQIWNDCKGLWCWGSSKSRQPRRENYDSILLMILGIFEPKLWIGTQSKNALLLSCIYLKIGIVTKLVVAYHLLVTLDKQLYYNPSGNSMSKMKSIG